MEQRLKHPAEVVGVGDCLTARGGRLVTHALGSCLGLTAWDCRLKIGGLLHAMLPLARINPEKAAQNPAMFVETGVPALFQALITMGSRKADLVIKSAGCANPLESGGMFRVGERNLAVLGRLMDKNGLKPQAADVGGTRSRTMHFDVQTGRVFLSNGPQRWEL